MIASEICKEEVQLVGVLIDEGRGLAGKESRREKGASALQKLSMHLGLARKLPSVYLGKIAAKFLRLFGARRPSLYARLRKKEDGILKCLKKSVGSNYMDVVTKNRQFPLLLEVAEYHGVAVHRVGSINDDESASLLKGLSPDVIIGLGTRIIRKHILDIPRLGILNGHSSLLPEYKGGTTEFWQMASGEKDTGVTIHWMVEKTDRSCFSRGSRTLAPTSISLKTWFDRATRRAICSSRQTLY